MITIYGISNCDTVRKARRWLTDNEIDHTFHDFRRDGLSEAQLREWADELNWELLLNRRGTTWRNLPDKVKNKVDLDSAIALMLEQPAMIKRPILDLGKERILGFNNAHWQRTVIV